MAERSVRQTAALLYQQCISLFANLRQLTEVDAPNSLEKSKRVDLRHVGEKLQTWHEGILTIAPDKDLDDILERSTHYIAKVGRLLDCMRDVLEQIYLLLSSPQGTTEDERDSQSRHFISTLEVYCKELSEDSPALRMSPNFQQTSFARPFERPSTSQSFEGKPPRNLFQTGRAATEIQSQAGPSNSSRFTLAHRSTMGPATSDEFRRKSSSAASQTARKPVGSGAGLDKALRSMSLSEETNQPACEAAREAIRSIRVPTVYSHRGSGPTMIFPIQEVRRVLLENDTAEKTFYCDCARCNRLSGLQSDSRHFDKESLTGKYATTFALLIDLYRAGLIGHFQKRMKCLTDGVLERDNLRFVSEMPTPTLESSRITVDEFTDLQYMFHLKKFEIQHHSVELDSKEALPIVEIQEEGRGLYGVVYSFRFLPGYAGKSYDVFEPRKFARKVFVKADVTSGIDEFNNLLRIYRLGTSQSPERWAKWRNHIMEALAGYEHGDIYFIIFPFAESTLAKYLRGEADLSKLTPRYMWRQMEGIAGGLAFLHESYLSTTGNDIVSPSIAFHFDLKPENILIRNGVVMISDFGQSKFKKAALDDTTSGVDSGRAFFAYGPPEHNYSTYDKSARTKSNYNFDIWSLGGIFSEVITFQINQPAGRQSVLDYRNSRRQDRDPESRGSVTTFFLNDHTVKPSVVEQHQNLRAEIERRNEISYAGLRDTWLENFAGDDFFSLLTSMLSVISETRQRPRALEVQERLGVICKRAEKVADQQPARPLPPGGRLDIWQQAKENSLWDELPKSSTQVLCYYVSHGTPNPTRCVVLLQRPINRQMRLLLLWHHGKSQYVQRQLEIITHATDSPNRQAGVIVDYFGHLPTDAPHVDMTGEIIDDTDDSLLAKDKQAALYRIIPVTNNLTTCAALLFVNAEDTFLVQASLTGQYVVSNLSIPLRGGSILPITTGIKSIRIGSFTKRKANPENIDHEALLQIWSDVDLNSPVPRRGSVISSESGRPALDQVPRIHIALIMRRILYLFKLEHSQMIIPVQNQAQAQNSVILQSRNSVLYVDKINLQPTNGAIMVNIPEPDKYIKVEEAKFQFAHYQDIPRFWKTLEYCLNLWGEVLKQKRTNELHK